jgi:hypothetical protein
VSAPRRHHAVPAGCMISVVSGDAGAVAASSHQGTHAKRAHLPWLTPPARPVLPRLMTHDPGPSVRREPRSGGDVRPSRAHADGPCQPRVPRAMMSTRAVWGLAPGAFRQARRGWPGDEAIRGGRARAAILVHYPTCRCGGWRGSWTMSRRIETRAPDDGPDVCAREPRRHDGDCDRPKVGMTPEVYGS